MLHVELMDFASKLKRPVSGAFPFQAFDLFLGRCLVIWGLFSPCAFPAAFAGEATFFLLDISASAS
jgi:hypothetical protein